MTSWSDVASKALDFLMKPNGLGVAVVFGILIFAAYVTPMGVVIWRSIEDSSRMERTMVENTNRLEKAIYALRQSLDHTMANRPR